jgi:hypothetical protein
MSRFSLIYGARGEPGADSARMRTRLLGLFRRVEDDDLAAFLESECGTRVPSGAAKTRMQAVQARAGTPTSISDTLFFSKIKSWLVPTKQTEAAA